MSLTRRPYNLKASCTIWVQHRDPVEGTDAEYSGGRVFQAADRDAGASDRDPLYMAVIGALEAVEPVRPLETLAQMVDYLTTGRGISAGISSEITAAETEFAGSAERLIQAWHRHDQQKQNAE